MKNKRNSNNNRYNIIDIGWRIWNKQYGTI